MKLGIALILSIVLAVGVVAVGFTVQQISTERDKLNYELEKRTSQVAEEFIRNHLPSIEHLPPGSVQEFGDSICNKYHLLGVVVYYNNDSILVLKDTVTPFTVHSLDYISQSITSATPIAGFISRTPADVFQYIMPIRTSDVSNNAVVFYADAEYIDNIINSIWFRNFTRWFLQALAVSLVTILIIRWRIFSPINQIVDWIKAARAGNIENLRYHPSSGFLGPLHTEIIHIAKAMHEARAIAEEEAKLRSNAEAIWTPERLKVEMAQLFQNKKLIVVSNREPYVHFREGKKIKCMVPASGLITAMEPILKACGGLWIASGTGDADKETVDRNDKLAVPPDAPKYTLKRLWLTKEEENHYYYGFSNEGLYPLCLIAHTRPTFREEDWHHYKKVNADFAKAIIEETNGDEDPFVLIQDYHFALVPEMVKKEKPNAKVALFWHIPWPNPESFGICPWQKEILRGMLGADLIGFHTQYHCNHFLETVSNSLESRVAWENFSVKMSGQTTFIKPFPISIAFTPKDCDNQTLKAKPSDLLTDHGITASYMGIGVDRIDYTKGIIEKFLSIERFLEKNPAYQEKFTFVQIGAPSRTLLKSYSDMVNAVEKEAERINWRFKSKNWKPILLIKRHHSHEEILPFYQSADVCMVTSLHDGMNLVAKEYVATRNQNDGVLILSRFAGAAHELQGALVINPYDIEKTADAIKDALEMDREEQQQRMKQMRQVIVSHNIYSWAAHLLRSLLLIK